MANLGVHFTDDEMQEMMLEVDMQLKQRTVEHFLYQADVNGDNQVDFEEFKAMMTAK